MLALPSDVNGNIQEKKIKMHSRCRLSSQGSSALHRPDHNRTEQWVPRTSYSFLSSTAHELSVGKRLTLLTYFVLRNDYVMIVRQSRHFVQQHPPTSHKLLYGTYRQKQNSREGSNYFLEKAQLPSFVGLIRFLRSYFPIAIQMAHNIIA